MAKFSPATVERQRQVLRGLPMTQFEFQDLEFGSANQDLVVKHGLSTPDPESVRVLPIEWRFAGPPADAPVLYRDSSKARRPAGSGFLIIRCTLANAKVRVLIFVEAE